MECEETDVLKMIYNISYFSKEKKDKLDGVWFIHGSEHKEGSWSQLSVSRSETDSRIYAGI